VDPLKLLKTCSQCGATFGPRIERDGYRERPSRWATRRYCSAACSTAAQRNNFHRRDEPIWLEDENGCWVWQLALDRHGYGRVRRSGRSIGAHRWLYEQLVGLVPNGLELDHLCRNKRCVNPAHLEPVTHRENMRRSDGFGGAETCGKGHRAFVRSRSGKRYCVECNREYNQSREG
jgi:hypothetical protein